MVWPDTPTSGLGVTSGWRPASLSSVCARARESIEAAAGLLAVSALILFTAFFVAGEFALVAVDRTQLEHKAKAGSRSARSVLGGLDTLSFQLSGAQFGITVCALLLGIASEAYVARLFVPLLEAINVFDWREETLRGIAVVVAIALVTVVGMVVGELIPKNYAIAKPLQSALTAGNGLRFVNALLRPLINLFDACANGVLRLLGIHPQEERLGVHSLEELGLLMRRSAESGVFDEDEYSLLHRSVMFGEKTAADALVPRTAVAALARNTTVDGLVDTAVETGHSRFPVYAENLDDVIGIVHVKDAYQVSPSQRDTSTLDLVLQPAYAVPESMHLQALLVSMRSRRSPMAVVIDEYGGTAGLITLEDILEEIVGEIEDEYDTAERPVVTAASQGVWLVDGMAHHDELYDICGFDLPEGEWETLAGFLLDRFGRIPTAGDSAVYDRWVFSVAEMDGRRIARVRVTAPRDHAHVSGDIEES